jgi:hypothetical protein
MQGRMLSGWLAAQAKPGYFTVADELSGPSSELIFYGMSLFSCDGRQCAFSNGIFVIHW